MTDTAEIPLQSKEHRDLLDIIDKLRSQGISRYVDLPQIIVCGDQSSGKSSVLEAISGMSFPTKDNLCTRFATEVVLRRSTVGAINVSIAPGIDRSETEKEALQAFTSSIAADNPNLSQVIEDAKDAMGLSPSGSSKVFSTDVLRVEISGPLQPHLTMVDLPGLFEAGNREQSEEDAEVVRSMVLSYMKSPRSIILAVVSAKSDFALQSVTKYARRLDPGGVRTLGLITKPDTLDEGSESQRAYLELAQNKDVKFRLGWHVLRNRDCSTRSTSTLERDQAESEFFSKGLWVSLNPSHLGVSALRSRLSHVLRDQILAQLPNVLADVESGITDCKERLGKMGPSRVTLVEQRQYLLQVGHAFFTHIKDAVGGKYNSQFFGAADSEEGYKKRLRAVVQNTLTDFADQMRKNGHSLEICDTHTEDEPRKISRSDYAEKVKHLMMRSRGCELPGTYNSLIVGDLFQEQCKPWKGLIDRFTGDILDASYCTVHLALTYAAEKTTSERLLHEIIMPRLDQLKTTVFDKLAEILEPHRAGHPITYNHYLTENVQKAQIQRRRHKLEQILKGHFGQNSISSGRNQYFMNVNELLFELFESTEADMDRYASYATIDTMEAYYKVALKKVIDEVSVLAIERCLIQQLPAVFSPETVFTLPEDVVHNIAAENKELAAERTRLVERLNILERGFRDLTNLKKYPIPSRGTIEGIRESLSLRSDRTSPKADYLERSDSDQYPLREESKTTDEAPVEKFSWSRWDPPTATMSPEVTFKESLENLPSKSSKIKKKGKKMNPVRASMEYAE